MTAAPRRSDENKRARSGKAIIFDAGDVSHPPVEVCQDGSEVSYAQTKNPRAVLPLDDAEEIWKPGV